MSPWLEPEVLRRVNCNKSPTLYELKGTYASRSPPCDRSKTCRGFRIHMNICNTLAPCRDTQRLLPFYGDVSRRVVFGVTHTKWFIDREERRAWRYLKQIDCWPGCPHSWDWQKPRWASWEVRGEASTWTDAIWTPDETETAREGESEQVEK